FWSRAGERGARRPSRVAEELDRLPALQVVRCDHPRALAGGSRDIAGDSLPSDRKGEATGYCAEDTETCLERSIDESADKASGSVGDFLGPAVPRLWRRPAWLGRGEQGQTDQKHDDLFHGTLLLPGGLHPRHPRIAIRMPG